MKIHSYLLALAMILVPTCLMAKVPNPFGVAEMVPKHRNEVESHWKDQYSRQSYSKSENAEREPTRIRDADKESEAPSAWRRGSKSRRNMTYR